MQTENAQAIEEVVETPQPIQDALDVLDTILDEMEALA